MNHIVSQLDNVKQSGKFYRATCPICLSNDGNTKRNLAIRIQNGACLCHRCGAKTKDIRQLLDGTAIRPILAASIPATIPDGPTAWNPRRNQHAIAFYDFETMEGVRVQHVKFPPSDTYPKWSWRHFKNGTWYNGIGGHTPYLFKPAELETAHFVFLCEGEKDAERGADEFKQAAYGSEFAFTSHHGGSQAVLKPHHIDQLRDKIIVLVGDNDDAGRAGVARKASQLGALGFDVRVLDLGLEQEKADLYDYFERGKTAHDLLKLALDTQPYNHFALNESADGFTIRLFAGQFLSDAAFDLPTKTYLHANTGIGKTTYALKLNGQTILVFPTQAILEQQAAHNDADVYYQHAKTAHADSKLILTTPDSLPQVLKLIDASRFNLVIDEAHNIAVAGYRKRAYDNVVRCLGGQWKRVILMTGTPLPLVTANLDLFTNVSVQSPTRIQNATHIIYKQTKIVDDKEIITGDLIASILNDLPDSGRSLIFLNDKKQRLDRFLFELQAAGYTNDQIALINADQKQSEAYRCLIENERIPNGIRLVIATSVISEGFNIRDHFATVHLHSVSSIEAQQIVNRFRAAPADMVYWYNAGKGKAIYFNCEQNAQVVLDDALRIRDQLNTLESADPNDATHEAYRESRLLAAATFEGMQIVEQVEDPLTGLKRWEVSPVGVNHVAYRLLQLAELKHPNIFKANTARYGWHWCEPIATQHTSNHVKKRAKYAKQCEDERMIQLNHLLGSMREEGIECVKRNMRRLGQLPQYLQIARIVLSFYILLGSFNQALKATLWSRGNQRRANTIKRRVNIALSDNAFIVDLFEVGEQVSSQIILERLRNVIHKDPLLRILQNPDTLTSKKAVLVIKDYISLRRTKDAQGNNCYVVTDLSASMAKCPTVTNTDEIVYSEFPIAHLLP